MEALAKAIKLQYNEHQQPEIVLLTTLSRNEALKQYQELKQVTEKDKLLSVTIKQHRKKRSLDANAYMWVLLSKMAEVLNTTKDELYLEILGRYGVFTHIVVKPEVVERVKEEWRTVRELGEVKVNGKAGVQLQCYFGSSTYNTAEMAKLIDGIVSECKELGIDTMTPTELAELKQSWKGE
jgi:hypothetical protein